MFFITDLALRGLLAGCGAVVKILAAVVLDNRWMVYPFMSSC